MVVAANTITLKQRALMLAIADLSLKLRRAPIAEDLARVLGTTSNPVCQMANRLPELVQILPRRRYEYARYRLTPLARHRLGLPTLAYVAWPLPRPDDDQAAHLAAYEVGAAFAAWLLSVSPRIAPVSPYLAPHDAEARPALDAGAQALSALCDAAIVSQDPLLIGRPDVAAADDAGVPIVLVRGADRGEISVDADLWHVRFRTGSTVERKHGIEILTDRGRCT